MSTHLNNLDDKTECILMKFVNDTKLRGEVDARRSATVQRSLGKLKD